MTIVRSYTNVNTTNTIQLIRYNNGTYGVATNSKVHVCLDAMTAFIVFHAHQKALEV